MECYVHYVDRNQGNTSAKKKPDQLVHDQKSEESSGSVSNQFMQDLFNMEESDKPSKSDTQKLEAFLGKDADDKSGRSESLDKTRPQWSKGMTDKEFQNANDHMDNIRRELEENPEYQSSEKDKGGYMAYIEASGGAGSGIGGGLNLDLETGEPGAHMKLGLTTPGASADIGIARRDCFEGMSTTWSAYAGVPSPIGINGGGFTLAPDGSLCGIHAGYGAKGPGVSAMNTKKVKKPVGSM